MTDPSVSWAGSHQSLPGQGQPSNLADLLDRILDKGIVVVGDIKVNLLDIELLTVRIRLLIASVDRAKEMGIDWWEHDPALSSRARKGLEQENNELRAQLAQMQEARKGGTG